MTQSEIIGNKLIAEFMGYSMAINLKHETGNPTWVRREIDGSTSFQTLEMMPYHTSWDWLMPVLEKIERMQFIVLYEYFGGADRVDLKIFKDEGIDTLYSHYESGAIAEKLQVYWKSCVAFITWYNQNPQS